MAKNPKATRPLEYVAFLHLKMRVSNGFVFAFFAVDAFTGYAFSLDIEKEFTPEMVLKNIYFLCENPDFKEMNTNGFTLVMEDSEELSERIQAIIRPENGRLMYNKAFNNVISNPFLIGMSKYMLGKK